MTGAEAPPPSALQRHAAWLGPLIAVPGFLSYYLFFARYPAFRDFPWANLLLLAGAVALSVVGLRRVWAGGALAKLGGVAGLVVSAGLTGLLAFYCFVLSYQLPDASHAARRGQPIPTMVLASHDGTPFDLGAASREPLVLVFYRGFW